jgi:putative transposase
MREKRRREPASHLRIVAPPPQEPDERWSMDFMVDSFMDGRRYRALTIVDIYGRHRPIIEADFALNGSEFQSQYGREGVDPFGGCLPAANGEDR